MNSKTGQNRRSGAAGYRGRLAPSPTGYFHLGHLATFETARRRAREEEGILVFRNDNLDSRRCRPEYVEAMYDDLRWFGFSWVEGPDVGGDCGPYNQDERIAHYRDAWLTLCRLGYVYACRCSRRDVLNNLSAPHEGEDEPVYPGTCRPETFGDPGDGDSAPGTVSWRFRVSEGEKVTVEDGNLGTRNFVAGVDFGDFVIWRRDGLPSYHLAAVVDDAAMRITEVVRGADLLVSTARQILIYRALGLPAPEYYHCPLVRDESGGRLAKRNGALSLRALRGNGYRPSEILQMAGARTRR